MWNPICVLQYTRYKTIFEATTSCVRVEHVWLLKKKKTCMRNNGTISRGVTKPRDRFGREFEKSLIISLHMSTIAHGIVHRVELTIYLDFGGGAVNRRTVRLKIGVLLIVLRLRSSHQP